MPKSLFLIRQGDTPLNKIWSFLIIHQEYDYSMKDIAKFSKVGYTTLKKIWKDLKQRKIVIQTRTVGKAKMYRLNLKNLVVEKFIDFYWSVVEEEVDQQLGKKEKNYTGGSSAVSMSAHHI